MIHVGRIVAQRVLLGLLTLWAVSVIIFFAVELLPGDAAQAMLGQNASPEAVEELRAELQLDRPMHERYLSWLGNVVTGDLGRSLATGREIDEILPQRVSNTLFLALFAAILSVPLSLVLGVLAALYRGRFFDKAANVTALSLVALPEFFVAYILIILLAVNIPLFPPISAVNDNTSLLDRLWVTTLPAITLTFATSAHLLRMTRATLVSLLGQPYIEMARIKGVTALQVVVRHALPNAWGPIANIVAVNLAYLVVGVVVVETIFVYPGLGHTLVDSVSKRDIPVVQAVCLIFAAIYILLNLAADVVGIIANPRILHPR